MGTASILRAPVRDAHRDKRFSVLEIGLELPGWLRQAAGLVLLLVFTGCGEEPQGQAPKAPAKPGAGTPAATAPLTDVAVESTQAETYIYTPVGKRDPFKSSYREKKTQGSGPELLSPTTILQQFEIDQLKLIAVVSGISQPRAMVTTPDGKGHMVKIGTLIGKNFGRVVRIKTSELIIAEDYRDPIGRKVTNYITMALEREKKR